MKAVLLAVWRPFLGIWLAAAFLGLAFNALSPLGVRFKSETVAVPAPSLPRAPASAATPASPYSNQVLSVRLERPAAARSLAADYQNDTLGLVVLPAGGAGSNNAVMVLPNLPGLTWPLAKSLLASNLVVLVDARTSSAYQAGHIPTAVSLPSDAPAEEFERFKAKYPPNTPLVLYCGSASCPMALRLAQILIGQHGYANVRHIPGGFVEYRLAEQIAAGAPAAAAVATNRAAN